MPASVASVASRRAKKPKDSVDTERKLACGHHPSSLKDGVCTECPDIEYAAKEVVAGAVEKVKAAAAKGRKRKGKDKFELDHPDERDLAQTAVLKAVSGAEGKADPLVVGVDLEERTVTVSLRKLSDDGKHWLGVRFSYQKSDSSLHDKEGEEVHLRGVGIMEYLEWLRGKPLSFLKREAKRATGEEPTGNQSEAVVAYLAGLHNLEQSKGKECYDHLLSKQAKRKALANATLTESEYFALSLAPDGNVDQQLADLARRPAHKERKMTETATVNAELAEKRAAASAPAADDVKALKAAAQAAKAAKVAKPAAKAAAKPKATAKKPAAKQKAAAKKESKPKAEAKPERKVHKLSEFKEGMKVKYMGRNKTYRGRTLVVKGTSKTGVLLPFGDETADVSPLSCEIVKG